MILGMEPLRSLGEYTVDPDGINLVGDYLFKSIEHAVHFARCTLKERKRYNIICKLLRKRAILH